MAPSLVIAVTPPFIIATLLSVQVPLPVIEITSRTLAGASTRVAASFPPVAANPTVVVASLPLVATTTTGVA